MEDIVKAIEKLSEKDIVDYLIVVVPIVISVVAIIISIATAIKQNRIALSERRYNCIFQIKQILSFAKSVEAINKTNVFLALFDMYWGTDLLTLDENARLIKASYQTEQIRNVVEQSKFLFNHKLYVSSKKLVSQLNSVLIDAVENQLSEDAVKKFVRACDQYYEKDFKRMVRQAKM